MEKAAITLAMLVSCVAALNAHATTIVENFNYGATSDTLASVSGTRTDAIWSTASYQSYAATSSLTFGTPYSNPNNAADYGVMTGTNTGQYVTLGFTAGNTMTGTVWMSVLFNLPTGKQFIFYSGPGRTNGISIKPGTTNTTVMNNGASFTSTGVTQENITAGTTYMLLVKVQMNVDGISGNSNDHFDFYIVDSASTFTSESSLGAAVASFYGNCADTGRPNTDPLGKIAIALNGGSVDALRISNDTDAFYKVTGVPAPEAATLGMLGFGGLILLRRRSA